MHTTTVVIGAGHSGLAASRCLSDLSIDHVVLERNEVANSWRRERWDSLRLLTPNWQCRLPGYAYEGDDPDGFMTASEVAEFISGYAKLVAAPVMTGTTVTSVRRTDHAYVVTTDQRLLCLTRKEGRVRWIHQLPQFQNEDLKTRPIDWTGPVLVSNKLIVLSSDGFAEALSPYTGQLLGRVAIAGGTNIAPVVAGGVMYIYTNDAELVALR